MVETDNKNQNNSRVKIVVSAESLRTPDTGIYRYTKAILDGLAADNRFEVYAFDGIRIRHYAPGPPQSSPTPVPKQGSNYTVFLRRYLPRTFNALMFTARTVFFNFQCLRSGIKLYHEPNYISLPFFGKTIVTVHDLSVLLYPEFHPPRRVSYIQPRLRRRVSRADAVMTGTQAIKMEITEHLAVDPNKVYVTPYAGFVQQICDDDLIPNAQILAEYGVQQHRYFILVGSIEPRKNLARVIKAFSQIEADQRRDIRLLLVGSQQWGKKAWRDEEFDFISYAKNVSHDNLVMLYAQSLALVFPSLYEGFGIPIVEAMECGTPVITSNQGAVKEVAGSGAILVDPHSCEEIRDAMISILHNPDLHSGLKQKARTRCSEFAWATCVAKTTDAYAATLSRGTGSL